MLEKQAKGLENLFNYFNEKKFGGKFEDKPIITIQSAGRKSVLGWCSVHPIWSDAKENVFYEINITAEHLGDGLLDISETILHEMCHLSNLQDGIKDCSPKTQYHNKKFKDTAEAVGLVVEKSKKYGYGYTSLSDELKEELKSLDFEDVFNLKRYVPTIEKDTEDSDGDEGDDKPKKKRVFKYICESCQTEIKSKYSGLEISCKKCDLTFIEIE